LRNSMPPAPVRLAVGFAGMIAIAGLLALASASQPIQGRPVTTPRPIPPEAFRPFTLPAEDGPAGAQLVGRAGRNLDSDPATETAVTAGPVPAPDPAPPTGPVHVVRRGETLWQIAIWHRAGLQPILRWNDGVDPRRLVAGQRVLIPGGAPMPARPTAPTTTRSSSSAVGRPMAGRLLWPLPVRGTITSRFSAGHPGIDIAAPAGTTVRAIASGTVTWAGWKTNGGGNVVVIRHPDGMVSTYNHNQGVAVARGDQVSAGERIAWVGSTGWATGPHLDLRVEMGDRLVDPLDLY
jgi:LysM repeat protein